MCVQSKLVWEVSRYRNGGLAGGWWCDVTWSVRTCVGSVEGPELFETGASFDSFPSLARRNRSWRIIRENRLNKVTKLVKIDHTQSDLSIVNIIKTLMGDIFFSCRNFFEANPASRSCSYAEFNAVFRLFIRSLEV